MEKVNILHQSNPILWTELCRSKQWNSIAIWYIDNFLNWDEQLRLVCECAKKIVTSFLKHPMPNLSTYGVDHECQNGKQQHVKDIYNTYLFWWKR